MEVIILAGGMGTRLREVVADVPKPMAPINDKPFLTYVLDWLSQYPLTKIVLAVGYKADNIRNYFGNDFNGVPIVYSEEPVPLGTGGAIVNALKFIAGDTATIVNGDTYFPVDLAILNEFHQKFGNKLSIALKEMKNFDRYGTVEVTGDVITGFKEKQPLTIGLINGGIYVLNKAYLFSLDLSASFSFEQAVLEKESSTGNLKAIVFKSNFIDIGIPADYKKACEEL